MTHPTIACSNLFELLIFQVFLVLWWWLLVLLIIGTCQFVIRLFEICCVGLRFCMLKIKMEEHFNERSSIEQITIKNYISRCSIGNWFVLYQLSKNMDQVFFMDLVATLAKTMEPIQGYWNVFADAEYFNKDKGNEGNENYLALKIY